MNINETRREIVTRLRNSKRLKATAEDTTEDVFNQGLEQAIVIVEDILK